METRENWLALRDHLWRGLAPNGERDGIRSIAVIDRTAVANAYALIKCDIGEYVEPSPAGWGFGGTVYCPARPGVWVTRLDPFVALADLGSVVNAALFYDRVVVIHPWERVTDEIDELLGCGTGVRLDPGERAADSSPSSLMGHLLQDTWSSAHALVCNSRDHRDGWVAILLEHWKQLLPTLGALDYKLDGSDRYSSSPNQPTWPVFEDDTGVWRVRAESDLRELVTDNTFRGCFYVKLADELAQLLGDEQAPVDVRYIGGCLRTPIVLALYQTTLQADVPLERRLDELRGHDVASAHMPFWLDAVLARCSTTADFVPALAELRSQARPLRDARFELEHALFVADKPRIAQLARAMGAEVGRLASALEKEAAGVASTVVSVLAPKPVPELVQAAGNVAFPMLTPPLVRLWNRVFRPHLFAIQTLARAADQCSASLRSASRVFQLPTLIADEPKAFLTRLGAVRWVA